MSSIGTDIPYYNAPFTDFVDRGMVFLGSMQIYILLTNGRTSRKKYMATEQVIFKYPLK